MKSQKLTINDQLLSDNNNKSLRITSIILIISSMVSVFFLLLNNLGIVNFHVEIENYITISTSMLIFIGSCFIWAIPNKPKLSMTILLVSCFAMIFVYDFLFSYYTLAFMLIPLVLSTRYYNKKICAIFFAVTVFALACSSIASFAAVTLFPDQFSSSIKDPSTDFANPLDVTYDFLFKLVSISILFVIILLVSNNSRNLLRKQGTMAAEAASIQADLKNASLIQNQVLPRDFNFAINKGIDVYAMMKPAKEVAGDFYDFFSVKDNIYFLVGDVSDKGLYAAMFMMNVKNIIQSIALNVSNLDEIITQANKIICKDNKSLMFVTLWIGQLNTKTGKGKFLNAGHSFAFVKNNNGDIRKLENDPQPFIGAFPNYSYKLNDFKLEKGETVFIYTDGVTDALNNQEEAFGEENLLSSIKISSNNSKELCNNVVSSIADFCNGKEQFDDITLLALSLNKFDYEKEFESKHENIEEIVNSISKDLAKHNVKDDIINLVGAAIDDELDNIISYAYKGKEADKGFIFQYRIKQNELEIVITDMGVPFDPLMVKPADLSKDRKIGGLGIHLIKSIMDDVAYLRTDKENILVLTKKL